MSEHGARGELPGPGSQGEADSASTPAGNVGYDRPQAGNASENPMASFPLKLSVPDIEVRMVNAAGLDDYEIWLFCASVTSSAAIGFFVAWLQSEHPVNADTERDGVYLIVAAIFLLLFAVSFARTLWLRNQIRKAAKTYRMEAREAIEK